MCGAVLKYRVVSAHLQMLADLFVHEGSCGLVQRASRLSFRADVLDVLEQFNLLWAWPALASTV